jgi:hypothetical protein
LREHPGIERCVVMESRRVWWPTMWPLRS